MQAIILAAGMGKRLGEFTKENTKCMVPVNGVRLVDRVLTQLGLSLELPVTMTEVLREVKYDKKKNNNSIRLIIPVKIGECVVQELSFEELEQLFK